MRTLLLTIAFGLWLAAPTEAACANNTIGSFTCIQSAKFVYTVNQNPTLAFGSNLTAGTVIAGFVGWTGTGVTLNSVTGCGATYTLYDNPTVATAASNGASFTAVSGTGACTITFAFSASSTVSVGMVEISGADTTTPVGTRHASNPQLTPGTATDAVTSTAVTASGTDYCIGFSSDFIAGATINAGTGFTSREAGSGLQMEDKSCSGSNAATFTATSAGSSHVSSVLSLAAAGGGAVVTPRLLLLGVGL